jgi:hypothetical protein
VTLATELIADGAEDVGIDLGERRGEECGGVRLNGCCGCHRVTILD